MPFYHCHNLKLTRHRLVTALLLAMPLLLICISTTEAQNYYYPLDHRIPGKAGFWASALGRATPQYFQPVRFDLPGDDGQVTVYQGVTQQLPLQPDGQAGLLVGPVYRLKISNMSKFPGVKLFPSVELIDRLHPPVGKKHDYPVPIEFSEPEIEAALQGKLVTKVIYLEQPQRAVPYEIPHPFDPYTLKATTNLLRRADREGRPMAIIRLGGRLPDKRGRDTAFYGSGAPVVPSAPTIKSSTGKEK